MAYAVKLNRLSAAGINLCQDLDGHWEVRAHNEGLYTAPKSSGVTIEAALAAHIHGQRLCSTVGCDLDYNHSKHLSPLSGDHHPVGPKTRADWQARRAQWIHEIPRNIAPAHSVVSLTGGFAFN